MLVLSRKKSEWIDINGGISAGGLSICVVDVRGDKVRLGIEAPKEVPVHRREVQLAIELQERRDREQQPSEEESGDKEKDGSTG